MAAAAETLTYNDFSNPAETFADVLVFPRLPIDAERLGLSVEELPWLREFRGQVRSQAEAVIDNRRQQLREGDFESVPLDVDAVGTAEKAAVIKEHFGENSSEHQTAWSGLVLDCKRKWAEAMRKNTWEDFGVDQQTYNSESDMLFADGYSVDELHLNGLTPLAEPEETALRVNDHVVHQTKKELLKTTGSDQIGVVQIKPCPDWAIKSLKENPKSAHGGYAPEIEKLMVNFDWFDPKNQSVYHHQLGVSGKYITPEIMTEALRVLGSETLPGEQTKTEIHATQTLVELAKISTVYDVMKLLDALATERTGKNIFMGEQVPADHPKDYQLAASEAEARRDQQAELGEELARHVEHLRQTEPDHAKATFLVENYIQNRLLEIAEQNPDVAHIVFDNKTAQGFHDARILEGQGRISEANLLREQTRRDAPPASSCGAGSCGIEEVSSLLKSEVSDLLGAKPGEKLVHDKERPCNDCGEKEVYYAYTEKTVKAACRACGAKVVDGKRQPSSSRATSWFTILDSTNQPKKLQAKTK